MAGRDDDEVGGLAEVGVRDRVGVVPERHVGRLGGEGVEGRPPDEAQRALGEDRGDVGAGVDEAAADLDRLVGGDAAGDAEHDAAAGERPSHVSPAGELGLSPRCRRRARRRRRRPRRRPAPPRARSSG